MNNITIEDMIFCIKSDFEGCGDCRFANCSLEPCMKVNKMAIDILEKHILKQPLEVTEAFDNGVRVGKIGKCPSCGSIVSYTDDICEECYQLLRW